MEYSMENVAALEKKILELEEKVRVYEEKNQQMAGIQQKLGEVTNNYLMLHYLNKNIQNCQTSKELWMTYLHNISDKGFNYSNVAVFLPDAKGLFTVKYFLKDSKLVIKQVRLAEIEDFIKMAAEQKNCLTSLDQRKAAVPMVNHRGTLKAVLVVEKEQGFLFEDLELLDVYVQQTIATIENVGLNERLLQYQDLLGKRLDQFVLLHYIAKEINDGINYYDILKKYLRALKSPVGFNFKDSTVYIMEEYGMKRAFLAEEELFLETVDTVSETLIFNAKEKKCGILSADKRVCAMPLLTEGKVSAVIEILNEKEITFEQMQMLEIFAMQTSSVLDNAKLRMHLEYMSFHDSLTGLYNRAFFEKHLRQLKAKENETVGIIMCDVNQLKRVNDTIGHHAGDALIVAAADAIKNAISGDSAIATRIGGDEFAILVSPCFESDLADICDEINRNMWHYNNSESAFTLGMAIGWAIAGDNADLDELFRCADRNMYREKEKTTPITK